ncbi:MAG: SDR family NAD(P)-dependent oxidoreductase [Spirochaetaceae bacterium]|nr:SDR family NAD(P)-dependent oxidoreductase [Spirochaetaceae bacterium]
MSDSSLQGRVALVTGASRGIGRGIARRLALSGAQVFLTARSLKKSIAFEGTLEETVSLVEQAGGRAVPLAADLEKPAERDALVGHVLDQAGRLDILVNNAGLAQYAPIAEMPDAYFEQTIDHYLRVPFKLAQAAIPAMREQGRGWIVNIGSVTAQRPFKPYDDFARFGGATVYAAIKAALNRFTQGLAAELENDDIAVNLVAPSTAISTPGADRYVPADYPTEPVEYLAECVYEMSRLPARERTGLLAHSLHYARHAKLACKGLDDGKALPLAEIPDYAHPEVMAAGE